MRRAGLLGRRRCLLLLLVVVVLGAELPDVHAHDAETPGFYNEQCPLARLAVPGWGLPALEPETSLQPDPVADPASPPALVQPAGPARPAFAPRAPPATS